MTKWIILIGSAWLLTTPIRAQPNCLLQKDAACRRACELYTSENLYQGSRASQMLYDSIIALCPGFAPAYSEKSVPFLKNGDFAAWKKLEDEAVRLDPVGHLGDRGWCRFKFLHDYEGALADLNELERLQGSVLSGYSGDGNYQLRIIRALCQRELGEVPNALLELDASILASEKNDAVGLYDYLHRGATRLRAGDLEGALNDFQKQVSKYPRSAESQYWLGLAYFQKGQLTEAKTCLETSKQQFNGAGYQMNDPYCAFLDQVYRSDVEELLSLLQAKK